MITWKEFRAQYDRQKEEWTKQVAANGYSLRTACQELLITHSQMNAMCRKYGVTLDAGETKRGPKGIKLSRYIRCAEKGMTQSETAKRLGVSQSAVSSIATTHNINFKSARGSK